MGIYGAIAISAFLIFLLRYGMNALQRSMIRHVRRKRLAARQGKSGNKPGKTRA
ncbi:hypothetical protein VHN57_08650 [Sphingobium sp. WW5]|jgi:hypothetical protein|uniref:hypothetical protein n=1 Tax=Sphingobium sp. WW5 TaxID=3111448 RepID=UPI003C24A226